MIITFLLTIFGTFMTRSGVVQSVHAFGEDPELARLFTVFMASWCVFSFGWVIYRLPLLQARNELDSWVSREAAFLANNWILLFAAFFVLFATMFPTLSEAINGERLTVGPPFFNRWMTPVGLMLLLLTGIGPLLAWRKSDAGQPRASSSCWPVAPAWSSGRSRVALGIRVWSSGICFALCGFVTGTIAQEFLRGANGAARLSTGTDILTAMIGLVGAQQAPLRRLHRPPRHRPDVPRLRRRGLQPRRAGAAQAGRAGAGRSLRAAPRRHPGHRRRPEADGHRARDRAVARRPRAGQDVPGQVVLPHTANEPTTEVAIRRSLAEDLYIVMAGFELSEQTASVEIHINPLVNWIWIGFGLLALGTGIALLPERVFAFATARVGVEATAALLLLSLLLAPVSVFAQTTGTLIERPQLERELADEVMCTCGCRLPAGTCGMMNCEGKAAQLAKVHTLVSEGKSRDEVLATFVRDFGGQHILSRPIDEGYHRLLWILPYTVAGLAALALAVVARRWSRAPGAAGPGSRRRGR